MKRRNLTHGFAGLELLLVFAVVLLIAGLGAFLYGKSHPSKAANSQTKSVNSVNNGTSTTPGGIPAGAGAPVSTPTTTLTTVKVPEAGLQISVPTSMQDLTYHVVSQTSTTVTVAFSTKTIEAAVPACKASNGNGAFDTLIRGNGSYNGPSNPSSGGLIKQYSNYYLAYNLPNGPCAKNLSTTNQALLSTQAQDFYSALTTVKSL